MNRKDQLKQIENPETIWDIAVIGGGATGLGVALDAALRGLKVVLFEASDLAKGTSSRSTKLVHGGVRYLAKGDVGLVLEALYERGLLMKNAPHLVKNQSFIIPAYSWWEGPFYFIGLFLYDLLAGSLSFGRSKYFNAKNVIKKIETLNPKNIKGGILYHDGQFDDSRLAINLAQSCTENGGCILNYMKVDSLQKDADNKITGLKVEDVENKKSYTIRAKSIVNATGVFVDSILKMDNPLSKNTVRPSQGVHIVLDKKFLPGDVSLMIPKTDDGRVLFAIPWHNKVVIGTTDTLINTIDTEPQALDKEIDFILDTAGRYLTQAPQKNDVLSVFAGLRPLAAPMHENQTTKEISRKHKIIVSSSGLVTIIGGKWTTCRKMAQDTIDTAIKTANLTKQKSTTANFHIHGYQLENSQKMLDIYGSDKSKIEELIHQDSSLGVKLHPDYDFTIAHVIWAIREEMARSVEDIFARRIRFLFLDARLSMELAPKIAEIMAREFGFDSAWVNNQISEYNNLAKRYLIKETA